MVPWLENILHPSRRFQSRKRRTSLGDDDAVGLLHDDPSQQSLRPRHQEEHKRSFTSNETTAGDEQESDDRHVNPRVHGHVPTPTATLGLDACIASIAVKEIRARLDSASDARSREPTRLGVHSIFNLKTAYRDFFGEQRWRKKVEDANADLEDALKRLRNLQAVQYSRGYNASGLGQEYLHCAGCKEDHLARAFSPDEKGKSRDIRVCTGRNASIRLCDHVQIKWADVETAVKEPMELGPLSSQASDFIHCENRSHNFHCGDRSRVPTCPQAKIIHDKDGDFVLRLHWAPHSKISAFARHHKGRIDVSELHAVFKRYRRDAARHIAPDTTTPRALPEMKCFSSPTCACLQFQTRHQHNEFFHNVEGRTHGKLNAQGPWFHRTPQSSPRPALINMWRCTMPGEEGEAPCIVTAYSRDIHLGLPDIQSGRINPSRQWCLQVEPDSGS
ncbi:Uu.00g067580.m01.CDS01 [Anthostomella pinea]|uniref:Uu.00g067580.m01.CDS01 n=1 Tax=Anthostomella pinea TaxID=933095 RepID=A0AAI8YND0_9PEZI|nr:Uu.00g067580.m01.CDS01 [Anthostomella pinea]